MLQLPSLQNLHRSFTPLSKTSAQWPFFTLFLIQSVRPSVRISSKESGRTCTEFAATGDRVIPKSSLSQHIKVLREAGLIRCERHGVEMRNFPRCQEMDQHLKDLVGSIFAAHGWYYRSTAENSVRA